MKTACFFHYDGPGRISIARWVPRGTPGGYRIYKALAPTREMLRMGYDEYRELYFGQILAKLDAREVWVKLHDLAAPAEPVLLCWERFTKPGEWCHRQMVAEWFQRELGEVVPEINRSQSTLEL